MKKILCVLTVSVLLLSGCSSTKSPLSKSDVITSESTQPCTLKWCLTECGLDDDIIDKLNETLRADGCQYDIELVQMEHSAEKTYSEQVEEYEKTNTLLDVVSAGYAFSSNATAGFDFIQSGYYMPINDVSEYTLVPDKLWETVKINGNIYTVPSLAFNDSGVTFYFNKAYISEQQISDFDGTLSKLLNTLNGFTSNDEFVPIYYNVDYIDFAKSLPHSAKGGLLLDATSKSAVNPYQFEEFVSYAKTLNDLYANGLFGKRIDFSKYDYHVETPPKDFAVMVSPIALPEQYFIESDYDSSKLVSFSLPAYIENRVLYSMGIAANSSHQEQAMDFLKRLYSDTKYANLLLDGTGVESMSVGLTTTDIKGNYKDAVVSCCAGFELPQNYINIELRDILISSFDSLCKSENFDETLSEINAELNNAGINDYISSIDTIMEENNASAN